MQGGAAVLPPVDKLYSQRGRVSTDTANPAALSSPTGSNVSGEEFRTITTLFSCEDSGN